MKGKTFALQEVMDQIGAFLGPIFVFLVLSLNTGSELDGYRLAFGLLGIFAILTLVILVISKFKYPHPDEFDTSKKMAPLKGNKSFIIYMFAISFIAFGFIDYPFLAFHLEAVGSIDAIYIPLLYSLAMGVDAIAALLFGYLFDKISVKALVISTFITLFSTPVFFLIDGTLGVIFGIVLWGIGMGAQESILKAVISKNVPKEKRGTAYGIFYTVFGLSWFIGSSIVGALYGFSIISIVIFSIGDGTDRYRPLIHL